MRQKLECQRDTRDSLYRDFNVDRHANFVNYLILKTNKPVFKNNFGLVNPVKLNISKDTLNKIQR